MDYIEKLKTKKAGQKKKDYEPTEEQKKAAKDLPAQYKIIVEEIKKRSGLEGLSSADQYGQLEKVLKSRNQIKEELTKHGFKEDVSVVGEVTEYICEIGLKASAEGRYGRLPDGWKWFGDFAITGLPFNLYVSVKSYSAKERLLVSGSGQGAAPVIGYGLFKDLSEWSPNRVKQYQHRGFVAIYMPDDFYASLKTKTDWRGKDQKISPTEIKNIYDKPLLRKISDFVEDLKKVVKEDSLVIDITNY